MLAFLGAASGNGSGAIAAILFFALALGLYFLPSIVATSRKVHNAGAIFVINFFLGWTFVGWVIALAMACGSHRPAAVQQTFVQNQVPNPVVQKRGEHAAPIWDHVRQAYVYQDPVTRTWLIQDPDGKWSPVQQSQARPPAGPFRPPQLKA